jgi:hypothetical protein
MIPTPASLRATHRRLARRVGRIERAERVLAEMRDAGAALHLQHTKQGPCWTLSNGTPMPDSIAKLVTASSSVVGVGDALFSGVASQQTYRWWKTTEPVS